MSMESVFYEALNALIVLVLASIVIAGLLIVIYATVWAWDLTKNVLATLISFIFAMFFFLILLAFIGGLISG